MDELGPSKLGGPTAEVLYACATPLEDPESPTPFQGGHAALSGSGHAAVGCSDPWTLQRLRRGFFGAWSGSSSSASVREPAAPRTTDAGHFTSSGSLEKGERWVPDVQFALQVQSWSVDGAWIVLVLYDHLAVFHEVSS